MNSSEKTKSARVLIIDDDINFNPMLVSLLTRNGYLAWAAMNGPEGLALALQKKPDIVLCDLDMPGMDGYEVLVQIRGHDELFDLPVIFLTGRAEPGQIRQGMNVGADDYLTKPVNVPDLLNAIQARLKRKQAERQRTREQAEKAGQLFSGIVRDLRDPLFVVLGYTDLLGSEGGDPASPDRKQILERMQQAIERMQAILAETMFVAKSRMQRLPFDPAPADLRHVCEMLVSTHEGRDRLHLTLPEFELRVVMDVVRVRQALENVVSNALKFSTGAVDIQLALHQGRFQITIVDSGIGVPTAEVSKLGEPFFRASNAAQYPGNGLGLCIVKACVEQHGGSLKVSNNSEQGIQVILELPPTPPRFAETRRAPLAVRNVVPAIPAAAGAAPALLSVMIVDDDALVRGMLRDILERAEAARVLSEAGTGAEARLLLEQQTPDVIFLDVHLPDVSGFDLLHELKPATSVIFLSHAEEHAAHAFDCDAVDFLLKPVTAERVLKSLEKVRSRQSTEPIAAAVKSRLDDTFLVKTLTEKRLVKVGEIRNIAAYGEYSWVYWDQGKGAMLRKPLKQWLGELPEEQFLRVHRGAIVNLAYLEKVERLPGGKMQIRLRDTAEPIQVSLRLASTLNRRLKGDG